MMESEGLFKISVGGFLGLISTLFGWLHIRTGRVEKEKLEKDVFKEFREANNENHKRTHDTLGKIWDKMEGKQDKD